MLKFRFIWNVENAGVERYGASTGLVQPFQVSNISRRHMLRALLGEDKASCTSKEQCGKDDIYDKQKIVHSKLRPSNFWLLLANHDHLRLSLIRS